jgi:hypothetical protein
VFQCKQRAQSKSGPKSTNPFLRLARVFRTVLEKRGAVRPCTNEWQLTGNSLVMSGKSLVMSGYSRSVLVQQPYSAALSNDEQHQQQDMARKTPEIRLLPRSNDSGFRTVRKAEPREVVVCLVPCTGKPFSTASLRFDFSPCASSSLTWLSPSHAEQHRQQDMLTPSKNRPCFIHQWA